MNVEFALAYIHDKMEKLGVVQGYFIKYKHFMIQPLETKIIDAYNEYYFLIQSANELKVRSVMGVYDMLDTGINEQQHEHQGKITITNSCAAFKDIIFIQVSPKHL